MRLYLYILLVSFFFSCENPPPETRADRIAIGICDCSSKLLELNKIAAASQDSIDFEGIQAEFGKTRTCIQNQHMKPEDAAEVQKSLLVKCPDLAKETELLGDLLAR